MFVFKGMKADPDAGTPEESFEEFMIRQKQEYDDSNPLIVPYMNLPTFIDVPQLCLPSTIQAADELLKMVGQINDSNNYVIFLTQELASRSQSVEINIDQRLRSKHPELAQCRLD